MNKYHAAAIAILVVLIILAILVKDPAIVTADTNAFLAVNNGHSHSLNGFMIDLTKYGREEFWVATVILLFIFGGWSGKKAAVIMAISMAVLILIGTIAKDVVARERPTIPPSDIILVPNTDYSFPSGHATIVSAGAGVALALFRDTRSKLAISIGLSVEALLVCISRVYVGGHYPTDVIGGILLSVGVSFWFVGLAPRIERRLAPLARALRLKR